MDLVYIVKKAAYNFDLLYSLRSVDEFVTGFDRVFIAGYKPHYVSGIRSIPTKQNGTKWRNALENVIAACKSPLVSDDFVLMNDDFFAIKPVDISECKFSRGSLTDKVKRILEKPKRSLWEQGHVDVLDLLQQLKVRRRGDYSLHVPMILNKQKFLAMVNLPEVQEFLATGKPLMFRTLYGNLYPEKTKKIEDVKIPKTEDLSKKWTAGSWISTYDGVIRNARYPLLNEYLKQLPVSRWC